MYQVIHPRHCTAANNHHQHHPSNIILPTDQHSVTLLCRQKEEHPSFYLPMYLRYGNDVTSYEQQIKL